MANITNTAANLANGIGWKAGDKLTINNGGGNNNATIAQLNLIRLGTHTTGAPATITAATVTDLSVTANDLNLIDAITTGKVVATAAKTITGTATQIATAITATGITLATNVGVTVSAGSVSVTDLATIDSKTTGIVNATAVTTITGTASAIATEISSTGINTGPNVTFTVAAGSVAATDLNKLDAKSTVAVNASAVTVITGLAADIATALNSTGITKAANVAVTVSAGIASATDLTTIHSKTSAVVNATAVTTVTGTATQVKALYATSGITISSHVNISLSGSVSVADLNTIHTHTTGVITATVSDHAIGVLKTLTGVGNAYAITISDKTATANDLNIIDSKTTVQVMATAVTSITGMATDIAKALSSTGISHAANVGVTVSAGTANAADLNTIDSNTTKTVVATAVTSITGLAADIAQALSSTGISHSANVDVKVSASIANAADLNTIDSLITKPVIATALTGISGLVADIKTAINSTSITLSGTETIIISDTVSVADINTIETHTTGVITATVTENDVATLLTINGTGNALNITITDASVAAASLTAIALKTTGTLDATQVTELTGTQTEINAALAALSADLSYAFAITLAPTDTITVAELNYLATFTYGVITATVSDTSLTTLDTFVTSGGSTGNITFTVTDTTADAHDLVLLSQKTTVAVNANAVTTFTGTATDVAYVVNHASAVTVSATASAIVSGTASALDLNTIVSKLSSGTIDATQVTSITGTQATIDTTLASATLSLSTTYAVTVSTAITVAELNILTAHTAGQITATISDANITTLLTYVANVNAQNINNLTFSITSDSFTPVAATDLATIAGETNVPVDATNVALINGAASDLAGLLSLPNVYFSTTLNVTVNAGSVNAADLNTIFTALNASGIYTGIIDASQVTELTGTQADINTALLNMSVDLYPTYAITLDPSDTVTVAELNFLSLYTSGIITATVSDTDLATLDTFIPAGGGATNHLTISVTDSTAAALDLILLSQKTTIKIDTSTVSTFSGSANDVAYVLSHTSVFNIGTAASASIVGNATAVDLNNIVTSVALGTGTIDASQVTSITGTQTAIDTALASTLSTSLSTTYAIIVSTAITVTELNSLALHTEGQITATVSDTNIATLLTYAPNVNALGFNNITFNVVSAVAVNATDLAMLASETNAIVIATGVVSVVGTASELANLLIPNNVNLSHTVGIVINAGVVNAADLNTIDTILNLSDVYTGIFNASAVTGLTGSATDIASALINTQITGLSHTLTATIDAGSADVAAIDSLATTSLSGGIVDATAVTELSGSVADIDTALSLSNVHLSSAYDVNLTDTGTVASLAGLTTTGTLTLGATSNAAFTVDLSGNSFSTVVIDGSGVDTITASSTLHGEAFVLGFAQAGGTTINGLITNDTINVDGSGFFTAPTGTDMGSAAAVVASGEWSFDATSHSLTYYNDAAATAETIVLTGVTSVTLTNGIFTV